MITIVHEHKVVLVRVILLPASFISLLVVQALSSRMRILQFYILYSHLDYNSKCFESKINF